MQTLDLFKINRTAARLNEGFKKAFGKKINLENFELHQLHDARNKLRTQISQVRSAGSFNEAIESDAFFEANWMLDSINAEINQREESACTQIADEGQVSARSMSKLGNMQSPSSPDMNRSKVVDTAMLTNYGKVSLVVDKEKHMIISKREDGSILVHMVGDHDSVMPKWKRIKSSKSEAYESIMSKTQLVIENAKPNRGISNSRSSKKDLLEGEVQQASAIVTAKTMADRVGRWIEELSGMENDTLLQLGDSIRDEMSQDLAKQFVSQVAPAIRQALEILKSTREIIATSVRVLTGEEQSSQMLGSDPMSGEMEMDDLGGDMGDVAPDAMNDSGLGGDDDFAAAEPAAGGIGDAGRAQRESIQFQNRIMQVLAG
jgi:hypothetical protein